MTSRALLPWSTAVLPVLLLTACGEEEKQKPYAWQLPPGFPEPFVPADNPMSEEKVALGRYLFYDERLSGNGTMACASCHEQKRAFSDAKVTPSGSTGHAVPRNSPGLANVAYLATYTWANPVLDTLEKQALVRPFELSAQERADLIAFLESLTGQDFVNDPRLGDPFDEHLEGRRAVKTDI